MVLSQLLGQEMFALIKAEVLWVGWRRFVIISSNSVNFFQALHDPVVLRKSYFHHVNNKICLFELFCVETITAVTCSHKTF